MTVTVGVNASGRAQSVAVETSCGYPELDAAAVKAVRRARFRPARAGGRPVADTLRVAVTFRLEN